MKIRHGFFVPQDELDKVGPCRGLDAETRLCIRLQNVCGVNRVEVGPLVMIPGVEGVHRMYAVTRQFCNDELTAEMIELFVQDAIVEFFRTMAARAA